MASGLDVGSARSFVEQHGLWSPEQHDTAAELVERIKSEQLDVIRFAFPDQHGILRGKTLVADEAIRAFKRGCTITTTLFAKDTSHRTVFPVFSSGGGFGTRQMQGGADAVMVPDPSTFRILPWATRTGWLLCDVYFPDGNPVPYSTRHLYRTALSELRVEGYDYVAGLEVEFHVFRLEDPHLGLNQSGQPGDPPAVTLLSQGYQYLTEQRYDQIEPVFELIRRHVLALGLPLRSMEVEFGPSQLECTLQPTTGLLAPDMMVLFRAAVKQICGRHGYHATFMCRPKIPNVMSSGWHLHQSLADAVTGVNAFMSDSPEAEPLSTVGRGYLAGLLAHARAATVFAAPTINAYRRYRAYSLAPDRAVWAQDNRGVMIRVLGTSGDAGTHLENRLGEPSANPYLYMASQIVSGLDGIRRGLDPGPPADTPYETKAEVLPRSLREAVDVLRSDDFFRKSFGDTFVNYYVAVKDAEIARFESEVTDWEHREYFEIF